MSRAVNSLSIFLPAMIHQFAFLNESFESQLFNGTICSFSFIFLPALFIWHTFTHCFMFCDVEIHGIRDVILGRLLLDYGGDK